MCVTNLNELARVATLNSQTLSALSLFVCCCLCRRILGLLITLDERYRSITTCVCCVLVCKVKKASELMVRRSWAGGEIMRSLIVVKRWTFAWTLSPRAGPCHPLAPLVTRSSIPHTNTPTAKAYHSSKNYSFVHSPNAEHIESGTEPRLFSSGYGVLGSGCF